MTMQKISSKVPKEIRAYRAFGKSVLPFENGSISPFKGMPTLHGFNYTLLDSKEKISNNRDGGPIGSNGFFHKGELGWRDQFGERSISDILKALLNAGAAIKPGTRADDLFSFRSEVSENGSAKFIDDSGREFFAVYGGGPVSLYRRDVKAEHVDIVNAALLNLFAKTEKDEMTCGVCMFQNNFAGTVYIFAGKLGTVEDGWKLDEFNVSKLRSDNDSFSLVVGMGDGISRQVNAAAHFLENMGIPSFAASNKEWGKKARPTPDDVYNRLRKDNNKMFMEIDSLKSEVRELKYKLAESPATKVREICEKIVQDILPKFDSQKKVYRVLSDALGKIDKQLAKMGAKQA